MKLSRVEVGVVGWLIAVLSFSYAVMVILPGMQPAMVLQHELMRGAGGSPYAYRWLAPHIARLFIWSESERSFVAGYGITDALGLAFSLISAHLLFRRFHGVRIALLGTAMFSLVMLLGFRDHYLQPWSLWESGFWAVGGMCALSRNATAFLITVAVASFNRETAIFLAPLYWLLNRDKQSLKISLCAAGISLAIFLGLRLVLPKQSAVETVSSVLGRNLARPKYAFVMICLAMFPVAFLMRRRTIASPIAVAAIPYLLAAAVFGVWAETRLLWPVVVACLPSGLFTISQFLENSRS